jgi:hypothetical protein
MSLIFATQLTAIATAALAVFAIITAWYARRAFLKQSQEVRAIEQQVQDAQEITRQQAELLKVQSGQLELQRQQVDDQRQANARQAEVFELQATELRESLDERKREAERRYRDQAARVFIGETRQDPKRGEPGQFYLRPGKPAVGPAVLAFVKNTSNQPVYDAELRWHRGSEGHGEPNPEPLGTLMPGDEEVSVREFPPGTNLAASGAVLRFRDAAGVTWMLRPGVGLTEQQ